MKNTFIIFILCTFQLIAQQPISLEEAYQKALSNNPELKHQNLNSEYLKSLENTAKIVEPLNLAVDLGQMNSIYFDNGLSIEQSFKFPGFYKSQKQVYIEQWKQSLMQVELQEHLLKKEIAMAYNQINYLNEKENLINRADSLYSEYYRLAQLRVEIGESSILEKTTALNYKSKTEIEKKQLQYDRNVALYKFNYLIADGSVYTAKTSDFYKDLDLFENNTSSINPIYLKPLEQEKSISEAKVNAEKSKKKPSFALLYNNMSMYGTGANDMFYDYSQRFNSGMVGVSIPVFNNGLNAKIESEKINLQIVESNIDLYKRKLEKELNTIYQEIMKLKQSQEFYLLKGNQNAETILQTALQLFSEGEINYLECILLVNQSLEIKNSYIDNQKLLNELIIELNALRDEN